MSRDFDILIVGGGVLGTAMASLAVAHQLAAPGRVAVIAPQWAPSSASTLVGSALEQDWDARVFALSRASQRLLALCGVWQALPPGKVHPYERMCVWDAQGAEPPAAGSLTFDCAELGEPNLGYIVEGRALQIQAVRAANAAGAVLIEAHVDEIITGDADVRVRLRDGRDLRGRLLIGADGTESRTRALLGIETAGHSYQQDALVAHVRTAKPHRDTAWQRFLPTGPLAFLPLPDGRSSIVWSAVHGEAERLRSLEAAAFGAALTTASGGVLGHCEPTTPIVSFPLKLQYAIDYVRPRAVLLGDAAHVVHPLAGQGLNLGLLDCAVLAEVLRSGAGDHGSSGVFGEHKLLRRYERRRRSENLLSATAMDGLERLFASGNPVASRLRVAALSAVARVPFVRRTLAERALGLSGDVPAFLRGDPLSPRR